MNDLISRQAAIETAENVAYACDEYGSSEDWLAMLINSLEILPSAQLQPEEDCDTCKHGYFGDRQCDNCRVRYPSHYEREEGQHEGSD